jgi:hypothetical protein
MAGRRSGRLRSFLLLAGALSATAVLAAKPVQRTPTVAPTAVPAPVSETRRFLLGMEANGKLAANAMVDAWVQKQGSRTLGWRLIVSYYPPTQAKNKPGQLITRHYGSTGEGRVGGQSLQLDLSPGAIVLDLPTPGGDRVVTLRGGKDAKGAWALKGEAVHGEGKQRVAWKVKSIPRFTHGKDIHKEVP